MTRHHESLLVDFANSIQISVELFLNIVLCEDTSNYLLQHQVLEPMRKSHVCVQQLINFLTLPYGNDNGYLLAIA